MGKLTLPEDLQHPDPESTAGKILKAAHCIFAENGFHRTTTRMIAEKAQVNLAMVHYYFGSKEKLYIRVIKWQIVKVYQIVLADIPDDAPPADILRLLIRRLIQTLHSSPDWVKLARHELADGGSNIIQAMHEMGIYGPKGVYRVFEIHYKKAVSENKVRDHPTEIVLQYALGCCFGMFFMQPVLKSVVGLKDMSESDWEERLERTLDLIEHGLFNRGLSE